MGTGLQVATVEHDGVQIVRVIGEIDIASAPGLRDKLIPLARGSVVVDMSAVSFCDSRGLAVLAEAHRLGGEIRLVVTEPLLLRVLAITALDTIFGIFSSLESALADLDALAS